MKWFEKNIIWITFGIMAFCLLIQMWYIQSIKSELRLFKTEKHIITKDNPFEKLKDHNIKISLGGQNFKFLNVNIAAITASVIFISPTFRSLAIWPDSRLFGLLFFVLSLIFFLKFKESKHKPFYYCLLNILFLSLSSYISPNFSIFSIYFFYYFAKKFDYKKIFIIVIFNLFLAFPAFYYLFILKVFFLTSGKTPGFDGNGIAFDFNFANKILLISSIIFFHLINFFWNKTTLDNIKFYFYQKKKFNINNSVPDYIDFKF
jgi:hypothetical protein